MTYHNGLRNGLGYQNVFPDFLINSFVLAGCQNEISARRVSKLGSPWGFFSFLFFQIPHYRRQSHHTSRFSSGKVHPGTYLSRIFVFVCEADFHANNFVDGCVSLKITPSMAASPQAKQMLETIKGAPTTKGFCRQWYPFRDRRSLLCHVTM